MKFCGTVHWSVSRTHVINLWIEVEALAAAKVVLVKVIVEVVVVVYKFYRSNYTQRLFNKKLT